MPRTLALCSLSLALLLSAATAVAQPLGPETTEPPVDTPPQDPVFQPSLGLKLFAGGNLWSTPSNVPGGYEGLGFAGNGGGLGFGGAVYFEARFFKHLGFELDLGYDQSTLLRNVDFGLAKVQESVTSSGPRIGLFAKGILPTSFGRLSLGLGPEFLIPGDPKAKNEITEGRQLVANADEVEGLISAEKKNSTMLTTVLGIVVHAGEALEIPIELRASKNMSQESAWLDRVDVDPATNRYRVTAQSSWDFRLGVGLGYRFQ